MSERKDYYGRSVGPNAARSRVSRDSLLRWAQVSTLVLGLLLVGWYLAARGQGQLASRAAIEDFRSAQAVQFEGELLESTSDPGLALSDPVNTSLWSEKRVRDYQQTLLTDSPTPLAILHVPKVGIEVPVFVGTEEWAITRGAGWIEWTAPPGGPGNAGIASHRDGFFRPLKDVSIGDSLVLETPRRSITYRIESLQIVEPSDVSVLDPTEESTITLITCYPFYFVGSAPHRFIVTALAESEMEDQG
ncbi:MAG: class D sortase [Acidobacteriota bacterium]